MSKKVEKVHNFLDPSLPQDVLDFFEFGKNWKFDDPLPLEPNLGKIWNWENFEFWELPPQKKRKSLKHLKLPKNHFSNFGLFDVFCWDLVDFFHFLWHFLIRMIPLLKKFLIDSRQIKKSFVKFLFQNIPDSFVTDSNKFGQNCFAKHSWDCERLK